ncbi:helix-turn-helix domain-containing protein [Deinococcus aestuarii]|uniref:helix-turn-helix domain-containing protein n=1 Tax=Deinococcus aestuarii TaxID=2774531 RepID=UPI001C0CC60A|nr:helix-turn-helix transcriptional regulator [Deinococcus aestuarii]
MPPRKRQARPEHLAFQVALGELIRAGRKPSYNQDDFADRVGVYRSHMGLIEQGKLDLRLSTLLAVAEALDLPLSELIRQVEARLVEDDRSPTSPSDRG